MKSIPISFISLNTIDQHHLHAIQMHILAYTWSVRNLEPYSGIEGQHESLWTLVDPDMYMRRVDIFPYYSLYFSFLIFPPKDFITPNIIDNRMTDFPHHHSIMYVFTPPIFSCLLHILLLFVRTISPKFTCINQVDTTLYSISIWVLQWATKLFGCLGVLNCALNIYFD